MKVYTNEVYKIELSREELVNLLNHIVLTRAADTIFEKEKFIAVIRNVLKQYDYVRRN